MKPSQPRRLIEILKNSLLDRVVDILGSEIYERFTILQLHFEKSEHLSSRPPQNSG